MEARANGADAVLLLANVLDAAELSALYARSREMDLDVLCEVHDESELDRALAAGCDLIGVNSRNLRTFEIDLNTPLRLAARMPAGVFKVAESGIHSCADLQHLRAAGFQAFLMGEALMRAAQPGEALRQFLAAAGPAKAAT